MRFSAWPWFRQCAMLTQSRVIPRSSLPPNCMRMSFRGRPTRNRIAYTAAEPPGENNWWVAKLYAQKIDGQPKIVLDPMKIPGALHGMQMAVPRWSPDGKTIAFIGGLMSDQGADRRRRMGRLCCRRRAAQPHTKSPIHPRLARLGQQPEPVFDGDSRRWFAAISP